MQRVSWLSRDSEASLYLLWQKSIMLSVNCSSQRRWTNAGDKGSHHSVWKPLHIWTSAIIRKGFFSPFLSSLFGRRWRGKWERVGCKKEMIYFSGTLRLRCCELCKWVAFGGQGRNYNNFQKYLFSLDGFMFWFCIQTCLFNAFWQTAVLCSSRTPGSVNPHAHVLLPWVEIPEHQEQLFLFPIQIIYES